MFYAFVHVAPSPVAPGQGGLMAFCTVGGLHPVSVAADMTQRSGRPHIVAFYAPIDEIALRAFAATGGLVIAPTERPAEPPPLPRLREALDDPEG